MTSREIIINQSTAADDASARLTEFPSESLESAHLAAKMQRMDEMSAWADAIGARTEAIADSHHQASRAVIEAARSGVAPEKIKPDLEGISGRYDVDRRALSLPSGRVIAEKNGDVIVEKWSPEVTVLPNGDTPAGYIVRAKYRSPINISRMKRDK